MKEHIVNYTKEKGFFNFKSFKSKISIIFLLLSCQFYQS